MKQVIASFSLFLFFSSSAFATAIDFSLPKNPLLKERGDFSGGGRAGARIPYVKSKLVQDPERGTVLEMDFNVSQGYGGTYFIFRPKKVSSDFNAVSFWVRGVHSTFKVELKDEAIHSFIVETADRSDWRQVVIPVQNFSNAESFNRSS
jgi:hypothetical protein